MKKVILALFAVMTLAACTGAYKSGNCEYHFLLHKDISVSKIIGNMTPNRAFFYFATITIAGRKTVSPNIYPVCISSTIVFDSVSATSIT